MQKENEDLKIVCAQKIAHLITAARVRKGWSPYTLARRSGVDAGHLSKIEDGFLCPRLDTLQKLCKALELNIVFPLLI